MKKKSIAAALALCLLCCSAFSMTAFAATPAENYPVSDSSATTSVLYTVQGGYTVNLPATVDLNGGEHIEITASGLTLPDSKNLVVRIDESDLDNYNRFMLSSAGAQASIACEINVSDLKNQFSSISKQITKSNNKAAVFTVLSQKNAGIYTPTEGGRIEFQITNAAPVAGNFSGSLHFLIGFEDPET